MDISQHSPFPLPIVDLKKAKDPSQRLTVAKQLVEALETTGFLYIDNMEGFDAEKVLNNARWFFQLSEWERHKLARKIWNPNSNNHYRGYFPLQPGEISYKEGFEIGHENPPMTDNIHPFFKEPNLWPHGIEGAQQFREDMVQYYRTMINGGAEILRLVSLGCGLEENWFQDMFFPDSVSTLRLLRYPARNRPPTGDTLLCCSEHSDSGFVTLLATFNYAGLQIMKDGEWMDVQCRPNSLVMNIGDLLSNMSAGRFKATRHRVIDTNIDRFSVPFFFEPRCTADVTKVMPADVTKIIQSVDGEQVGPKPAHHTTPVQSYSSWLIEKMRNFSEYREILNAL